MKAFPLGQIRGTQMLVQIATIAPAVLQEMTYRGEELAGGRPSFEGSVQQLLVRERYERA